jgi:hypothetical protein
VNFYLSLWESTDELNTWKRLDVQGLTRSMSQNSDSVSAAVTREDGEVYLVQITKLTKYNKVDPK